MSLMTQSILSENSCQHENHCEQGDCFTDTEDPCKLKDRHYCVCGCFDKRCTDQKLKGKNSNKTKLIFSRNNF